MVLMYVTIIILEITWYLKMKYDCVVSTYVRDNANFRRRTTSLEYEKKKTYLHLTIAVVIMIRTKSSISSTPSLSSHCHLFTLLFKSIFNQSTLTLHQQKKRHRFWICGPVMSDEWWVMSLRIAIFSLSNSINQRSLTLHHQKNAVRYDVIWVMSDEVVVMIESHNTLHSPPYKKNANGWWYDVYI